MVPEKQDSPTVGQRAEPCSLPGGQTQKGGWGTGCYLERNEDSTFLPGHSVCAYVRVHHTHLWGVLSAIKARTDFNSENALCPPSEPGRGRAWPWPRVRATVATAVLSSPLQTSRTKKTHSLGK